MYREKFSELVKAISASKDFEGKLDTALAYLERSMSCFPAYVTSVFNMETLMPTLRFRLEPEDYREKVMELDRSRKRFHDSAIDAINGINRMCDKCGVEPFFAGDTSDRNAVAEFCGEVVEDVFKKRASNQEIRNILRDLTENSI